MSGHVCLQGGAEFGLACREMDAELVRRVGGGPVVVTALAGAVGADYRTATANGVRHFAALGAHPVIAAPDARTDPDGARSAVERARLLVLPGGSPGLLAAALRATPVGDLVAALLAAGTLVMGASAGAMLLCAWTVVPDQPGPAGPRIDRGLGLVANALVLPHFRPGAGGWLAPVRTARPEVDVLGLPESSGLFVEGNVLTAVGVAPTTVFPGAASVGAAPIVLGPGERWERAA